MPKPEEIDRMRVVYELPGMENVPVKRDIIYKTVANEDLTMDIYYPLDMQHNVPITFMNYPTGEHGFDIFNDHERSREIIKATLAFVQGQLAQLVRVPR